MQKQEVLLEVKNLKKYFPVKNFFGRNGVVAHGFITER